MSASVFFNFHDGRVFRHRFEGFNTKQDLYSAIDHYKCVLENYINLGGINKKLCSVEIK